MTFLAAMHAFPGIILELTRDGRVLASNGRLEQLVGMALTGEPLTPVLDAGSAAKWEVLHRGQAKERSFELIIEAVDGPNTRTFHLAVPASGDAERMWLIELPKNHRIERLHDDLTALNTELINTQRDLAKGRARLNRVVAQLEATVEEKTRLSDELRSRNIEVKERNRALTELSEELRQQQVELQVINEELAERGEELEKAIAAKERLHAIMSHELRTPLTAIAGYNHLLLDGAFGELRPEQRTVLQRMRSASQHLQSLIDDVLDFAKIESGELLIEPHDVRVHELLEDVVATIQPLAHDRGSAVHMEIEDAPEIVVSDTRRLRQILLNLLSNAAKYGGGNAVALRARQRDSGELVVEVADSGAGIAKDQLDAIFREFVQLDQQQGGSGLGLPIARRLTQLLGGELEVESEVGRGSTFRLVLPRRAVAASSPAD